MKIFFLLFVVILISTVLNAQESILPNWIHNKVYFDADYDGIENGTVAQPYKTTRSMGFKWESRTAYLFKRGTETLSNENDYVSADSVVIGAYGTGKRPKLIYNVDTEVLFLEANFCFIKDIEVNAPLLLHAHALGVNGDFVTIDNCILSGGNRGISAGGQKHLRILNTEVYGCIFDGLYASPADTVTIFNCYFHDMVVVPEIDNKLSIDNIHIYKSKMVNIDSLYSDHSKVPGKFCLIMTDTDSASIKNSVFVGHPDNASIYGGGDLSLTNCYFEGGKYGLWIFGDNTFKNCVFRGQTDNAIFGGKELRVLNCSFINQYYPISNYGGMIREVKNCIFYDYTGLIQSVTERVDWPNFTNNCFYSTRDSKYAKPLGLNYIHSNPLFADTLSNNFRLQDSSPCLDQGLDVDAGLLDIAGIQRKKGSKLDYGAYEYTAGLPTAFDFTSDGIGCSEDTSNLILNGSEVNTNYKLYRNEIQFGDPISGTGSSIKFDNINKHGFYSVVAVNNATKLTNKMKGLPAVMVYPLPNAYFIIGGGYVGNNLPAPLIKLYQSDNMINYQLYKNDSPIGMPIRGTGTSINFGSQSELGIYTVVATNPKTACFLKMPNFVLIANDPTSSIKDIISGDDKIIEVYPNPSSGNLNIKFSNPNSVINQVSIYNQLGVLVYKKEIEIGEMIVPISLNVETGCYILQLEGKGVFTNSVKIQIVN